MDLSDRVRLRLAQLGKTSWAVCKDAFARSGDDRLSRDILRDLLRGNQKSVRADRLELIAYVLETSEDWLLGKTDTHPDEPPTLSSIGRVRLEFLPVRYKVAAGVWLEMADSSQAFGFAPVALDPDFRGQDQWLEEVQGDSMDRVFPPGTFVHVVDATAIGYAPRNGDHVVVTRTQQQGGLVERSLKTVRLVKGQVELWPESTNPVWAKPLSYTDGANGDEITVEIVGLVIGEYRRKKR